MWHILILRVSVAYDTIMKLTVSKDFGLISGEADCVGMFTGVDAAQTYRAMVSQVVPWTWKNA